MTPTTRHDDGHQDARDVRARRDTLFAAACAATCAAPREATPRAARLKRAAFALTILCLSLACAAGVAAQGAKKGGRGVAEPAAGEGEGEKGPPSNSVVRGRAVYEETGRPVRRARVQLYSEAGAMHGGGASALTGAAGEFEFKGVAAGRYLIAVIVTGALTPANFTPYASYGSGPVDFQKARQHFQEINVDGVGEVEVSLRARRGAAVSGRVTYENGDPAVGVAVTVTAKADEKSPPSWAAGRERHVTEEADDRGVYRFTGLPPGEYVVSVSEPVAHGDNPRIDIGPVSGGALFETFYPSTTKRGEAVAVSAGAGEEKAGIDIVVVERGSHKLSGTVVARKGGAPVANARVTVLAKDSPLANSPYASYLEHNPDTTTDEAGRFSLREIPDGEYVIHVSPAPDVSAAEVFGPAPARRKKTQAVEDGVAPDGGLGEEYRPPLQRYAAKMHEVKMAGRDLEGVSIELGGGGRITGTITLEGGKEFPGHMPIFAVTLDASGAEARHYKAAVTWRDQFAAGGVMPGKAYLYTYVSDRDEGYYVKSIMADGKDLTREFLQIEEGAEIRGVRIVVAEGVGKLEGRVAAAGRDKSPAGGAELMLVAADSARWAHPGSRLYGRSKWDGTFEMSAPPGDYFVFLLPEKDTNRTLTEADIRAHTAADAKRVTLRAKQTAKIELTVPEEK